MRKTKITVEEITEIVIKELFSTAGFRTLWVEELKMSGSGSAKKVGLEPSQGSIFWSKTDIYSPPPSEIYIFSPKKQRDFRATLPTTKSVNYRFWRK